MLALMMAVPLFATAFATAFAADRGEYLTLNNETSAQDVSPFLFAYEDSTQSKTVIEIQALPEAKWSRQGPRPPNYAYTDSAYWFRADIYNDDITRLNGILDVKNPLLNDLEFYFVEQGEITQFGVSGSEQNFYHRGLHHRNFLFQFKLEPKTSGTLYVRVQSESALQVPMQVASEFKFFEYDQTDLSMKSAYYGVMFVVILFNLFLFLSLRESVYLVYVLFIFSFALQQFSMHGFITMHFSPSFPQLQGFMVVFLMPITMFLALQFTRSFLSLDTLSPRVSLALKGLQLLTVAVAASVVLFDFSIAGRTVAMSAVFVSFACLLVGPYQWYRGQTIARYYTLAWICVAGGSAILSLNKLGVLPRTGFTENGLLAGSAAEAILLSFALADRLNMERKQRFSAQQKMLTESAQRKKAEDRLMQAALHHGMTGLPNRLYFERWFDEQKQKAALPKQAVFALLHINRFHEISQTLGHSLADALFFNVTQRLNRYMAGRTEFLALEKAQDQSQQNETYIAVIEGVYLGCVLDGAAVKSVEHGLRDLLSCLADPLEHEQMVIDMYGQAAWVRIHPQQHSGADLVRSALIAADVGIRKKDSVVEYVDEINPYSERRLTLAGELRKAIERDELQLYFQPQYSVKKHGYSSMEALLRWFHKDYGYIPPDEFIPIAEQSGLIHALTYKVVDKALTALAKVHCEGHEIAVAVNISAIDLRDPKFPNFIKTVLDSHQLESRYLVLEVTETAMMEDPELAKEVLTELAELGVIISIDDFGTGHSSLAYIKQLPVHEIKIDRSFVMDMEQCNDDAVIVRATLNMCHELGLEAVAEGVENDAIAKQLKALNCDYLQGYGLCRPVPLADLLAFLGEHRV